MADEPMIVRRLLVNELRGHPLNDAIYGDRADDELVARVQMHGIIHPLLVTPDGTVISGHRRLDAARRLGLSEVPVLVRPIGDPLEVEELVIEANRQREPTNEQRVREFAHLKALRVKRARRRPAPPAPAPAAAPEVEVEAEDDGLPPPVDAKLEKEATTEAARRLGKKPRTLEKGLEVVEHIDALESGSRPDEAAELRKLLNERSVTAAWRKVHGSPEPTAPAKPPVGRMRRLVTDLRTFLDLHPDNAHAETLRHAVEVVEAAVALVSAPPPDEGESGEGSDPA